MRFSLCNEVVRELPFAAQCDLAASLGYDGIELAPFTLGADPHRLPAAEIAALRRAASDAGIAITSLHWLLVAPAGLSITSDDAATQARTLDVIAGLVALAAELGATHLVHGSPAQRVLPEGADREAARARAIDAFAFAGERARAAGVVYCIEPLDRGQTAFVNTIAEAAAIVRAIGNPALRTMLDTCSAASTETEPLDALVARWLPTGLIAHVHLNDANRRAPGQGAVRFTPVLAALRAQGYTGTAAIEPFEYIPDGPTCAARAIGYLRGLLETLT
ncbi:sugar phosphate isomerase/epimerase family protein [Elioraea tepidiphila]|jgi:sugar phosphate isomerase/epimerase|uniref:sugar phosphate isomerase/epimerase family protein n=1 Tax=Elioraea tepidiphila TaxID=457934 RepID=UPI00036EE05B|nr:sugar phosphate isomerase/epimerase family protein [Elioraea tepidiphila]